LTPILQTLAIKKNFSILLCEERCAGIAFAGVVISIISEKKNGGGYALLLDGSTFREISRGAKFPCSLPYGFHGCWVPKK